ncbi:MAG: hypothetical protein LC118_02470 [Dehalococcoidia bacterium]|nr:hypothetical protein [Dehalococcoidia bacterium]
MTQAQTLATDGVPGRRLAAAIAAVASVERTLVATLEGELVACEPATPGSEAGREVALTTFVAKRAEALATDGDLRGMGRVLASSRLERVVISTNAGDTLLYAPGSCYVLIALRRGSPVTVAAPAIEQVLRRYV